MFSFTECAIKRKKKINKQKFMASIGFGSAIGRNRWNVTLERNGKYFR